MIEKITHDKISLTLPTVFGMDIPYGQTAHISLTFDMFN